MKNVTINNGNNIVGLNTEWALSTFGNDTEKFLGYMKEHSAYTMELAGGSEKLKDWFEHIQPKTAAPAAPPKQDGGKKEAKG